MTARAPLLPSPSMRVEVLVIALPLGHRESRWDSTAGLALHPKKRHMENWQGGENIGIPLLSPQTRNPGWPWHVKGVIRACT